MDLTKTVYHLYLVTNSTDSNGNATAGAIPLPFTGLQWEEQPNELAVRLQATVPNANTPLGYLHQLAALGAPVLLYADTGSGPTEIFRGKIWTWEFTDNGSQTVMLTCYDDLMYLQVSQDSRGYFAQESAIPSPLGDTFSSSTYGMTAAAVLADIAQAWGFFIDGLSELPDTRLPRLVFTNTSIATMCLNTLSEVYYRSGEAWLLRARQGSIEIVQPGSNSPVYVLTESNVSQYSDLQDMTQLVTEVEVLGLQATSALGLEASVVTPADSSVQFVEGNTQYGRFRAIVQDPGPMSPVGSFEMAERLLQDRGQPKRVEQFSGPDIPTLRRGDAVYLQTGTLNGQYFIDSIQHDADAMTMQIQINTSGSADAHLNNPSKISSVVAWLRTNGWST